jgi:hypothetical protein
MRWVEKHEQDTLNHYVELARLTWMVEYVKHEIKRLDARSERTGLHVGIKKRFLEIVRGKNGNK